MHGAMRACVFVAVLTQAICCDACMCPPHLEAVAAALHHRKPPPRPIAPQHARARTHAQTRVINSGPLVQS